MDRGGGGGVRCGGVGGGGVGLLKEMISYVKVF